MKKLFYIGLLCFFGSQVFAQNYSIEASKMDAFVADYAEEIIKTNTPTDGRQYNFVLTQNDNEFVISCNVTPGDINVVEQTDDLWNQMEATIIRAIKRTIPTSSYTQQTPSSVVTENPSTQQTATVQQHHPMPGPILRPQSQPQPQPTQQPNQNYTNIYNNPQTSPNGNMGYMYTQSCTIEDVRRGKAEIGEKICFSDGSCGVIFLLDGNGHGLAISLDEAEVKWQNAKKTKDCQDIYQLVNEKEPSKYCNIGLGSQQTQVIINQLGWGQAPAAEWCSRHGKDWYLPSAGELWFLFTVANSDINMGGKTKGKEGFISKMLQAAGGQPIGSNWYWSSSEEDQEHAWNVNVSGRYSSEDKDDEVTVRAVRYF